VAPHYVPFSNRPAGTSQATPTRTCHRFNYLTQRWEIEII
jgi:hypothetical protein